LEVNIKESIMDNTKMIKVKDLIKQLSKLNQEEYIVVDDCSGNCDNTENIVIDYDKDKYVIY